jgi:hypothetical protein
MESFEKACLKQGIKVHKYILSGSHPRLPLVATSTTISRLLFSQPFAVHHLIRRNSVIEVDRIVLLVSLAQGERGKMACNFLG